MVDEKKREAPESEEGNESKPVVHETPSKAQRTQHETCEKEAVSIQQPGFALVCSAGREKQAREATLPLLRSAIDGTGCSLTCVRQAGGGTTFIELSGTPCVGSSNGPAYASESDPVYILIRALQQIPGRIESQPCQRLLPAQDVLPLESKDQLTECAIRLVNAALANSRNRSHTTASSTNTQEDGQQTEVGSGQAQHTFDGQARQDNVNGSSAARSEDVNAAYRAVSKGGDNDDKAAAGTDTVDKRDTQRERLKNDRANTAEGESKTGDVAAEATSTTYGVGIRTRRMTNEDERQQVIHALAQGVESALGKGNYKVDLNSPSCALIAEALPRQISETGSPLVALAWLDDSRLFTTKGRLQVKPFNVDTAMQFCSFWGDDAPLSTRAL